MCGFLRFRTVESLSSSRRLLCGVPGASIWTEQRFEVTALSLSVVCNSHVIKIVCEYVLMLINVQKTCLNGVANSLGIVDRPLKRDSGGFTDILAHVDVTVAIVAS